MKFLFKLFPIFLVFCLSNGQTNFHVKQMWDSVFGSANGLWSNAFQPAVQRPIASATNGLNAVTNLTHVVSDTTNQFVNSSAGVLQNVANSGIGSTDLLTKPIVNTMNETVNLVGDAVKPNKTDSHF